MNRKLIASISHSKRMVGNMVRANVLGRQVVKPHFAVYHVNYKCNASCGFCSRSEDILIGKNNKKIIELKRCEDIFKSIRKHVASIYFAGGEPLIDPLIEEKASIARKIGFYPLSLNTNATLLHRKPLITKLCDNVVVSLHSVVPDELASIYRVPVRTARLALDNITNASVESRMNGNKLIANCVLTPENIKGARSILDFCIESKIQLAVVPAIINHRPVFDELPRKGKVFMMYQDFIGSVIEQKKSNRNSVAGTLKYLQKLKTLETFQCRPTTMLSVDPDGNVRNPCQHRYKNLGPILGNLMSGLEVGEVVDKISDSNYPLQFSACDKNCLKACHAEPSIALSNPISSTLEFIY